MSKSDARRYLLSLILCNHVSTQESELFREVASSQEVSGSDNQAIESFPSFTGHFNAQLRLQQHPVPEAIDELVDIRQPSRSMSDRETPNKVINIEINLLH